MEIIIWNIIFKTNKKRIRFKKALDPKMSKIVENDQNFLRWFNKRYMKDLKPRPRKSISNVEIINYIQEIITVWHVTYKNHW